MVILRRTINILETEQGNGNGAMAGSIALDHVKPALLLFSSLLLLLSYHPRREQEE